MAQARFLGFDTVVSGDWIGACGSLGWWMGNNSASTIQSLPAGTTISVPGAWWVHGTNANDGNRYPLIPGGGGTRSRASRPYQTGNDHDYRVSISFPADRYVLSIYAVDQNSYGRKGIYSIMDGATTLATYSTDTYDRGLWLRFAVSGAVDLRCQPISGANATVYVLAFDPLPLGAAGLPTPFFGHGVF